MRTDCDKSTLQAAVRASRRRFRHSQFANSLWQCLVLVLSSAIVMTGCTLPSICRNTKDVAASIASRTDHAPQDIAPGTVVLPPDVLLDDGLSEDEAIATAMTNNSAFQSLLTQMDMADADLLQAGLLRNPNLTTFLPISAKQWEWTLLVPVETILTRPLRVSAAHRDAHRVAEQLVLSGLTLVRDVRLAHVDLMLAEAQLELAREGVAVRQQVLEITERRLASGEISELELKSAQIDALNAEANAALLEQDANISRARLATLMGIPLDADALHAPLVQVPHVPELDLNALIDEAISTRPDLLAAEWAIEAAAERARFSKWSWLRVDAIADANSRGFKGYEAGPGVAFDVPIFNRNEGGVARANAEMQQAEFNRDAIRDQIILDVRVANAQLTQARQNLAILDERVVPALEEALRISRQAYAEGGVAYLQVLQTSTQYLDARSRKLVQIGAVKQAVAELERGVGRRVITSAPMMEELLPTIAQERGGE